MKTIILTLVLLLGLAVPVMGADIEFDWKWEMRDYILQGLATSLDMLDWKQTRTIALNPDKFCETNPILGPNLTLQEVDEYAVKAILGSILISALFPKITIHTKKGDLIINSRTINQLGNIFYEIPIIANNYHLGIYPQF